MSFRNRPLPTRRSAQSPPTASRNLDFWDLPFRHTLRKHQALPLAEGRHDLHRCRGGTRRAEDNGLEGVVQVKAALFLGPHHKKGHVIKCSVILERHTQGTSRSVPQVGVEEPHASVCVPGLCTYAATRNM